MKLRNALISCLLFCLALSPLISDAQDMRLSHVWSRTNLSFDLNRLYDYNIYERNRWGAGFSLETPLKYDSRYGTLFQNTFYADIYGAYGTGDHAWKFGGSAQLRFPRSLFRRIHIGYMHDIEQIGRHDFNTYNIINTFENSTYFSSRFSLVKRIALGIDIDLPGRTDAALSLMHSDEQLLFNYANLLFPAINDDDALPQIRFDELMLNLRWSRNGTSSSLDNGPVWMLSLRGGTAQPKGSAPNGDDDIADNALFARTFLQYTNTLRLGKNKSRLQLYAQGGITIGDVVPLSRRFNISGTGGSRYFFSNSLLTVRPNTFIADNYVHLALKWNAGRTLWNANISKPRPFMQLNAVWGSLRSANGTGDQSLLVLQSGRHINDQQADRYTSTQLISLVAPAQGLLEPAAGFDNLLRWNFFNLGIAVAYQLTPKNSVYHLNNFFDKFAVMCIAKLDLNFEL